MYQIVTFGPGGPQTDDPRSPGGPLCPGSPCYQMV